MYLNPILPIIFNISSKLLSRQVAITVKVL